MSSIVLGDAKPMLNACECPSCINTPHRTQMPQLIRSGTGYSEDGSDSDSDYEDALEWASPSGATESPLDQESEPEPTAISALSIGAFPT
jgi:hypothetical protein